MAYGFPFQMRQNRYGGRSCPTPTTPTPIPKHCPPPVSAPPPLPCRDIPPSNLLSGFDKIDADTLLLLILVWAISKENCDKKLLYALCYILL